MLNLLTDRALAGISLGCTKLQAINVAGAKKISEAGLCEVARRCGNLGTLNVGGCELVTRNGLLALIEGLEYVEEAKTFFGFLPIDKSTDVKLKAQQEMIENSGAIRIQNAWHNMITRREAKKMVKFLRENKAALSIQLAFQRYLKRKAHWLIRWEHHRNLAMVEVQRVLRGYWGRKRSTALMLWWRELLSNAQYAVLLQAKARGHHVRKHDKLVAPAHRPPREVGAGEALHRRRKNPSRSPQNARPLQNPRLERSLRPAYVRPCHRNQPPPTNHPSLPISLPACSPSLPR